MVSNYAVKKSVFIHIPEYIKSLIFCMNGSPEFPGKVYCIHSSLIYSFK